MNPFTQHEKLKIASQYFDNNVIKANLVILKNINEEMVHYQTTNTKHYRWSLS